MRSSDQNTIALYLAGKMANVAGKIIGEELRGSRPTAEIEHLPILLAQLKETTAAYNTFIMEMITSSETNKVE